MVKVVGTRGNRKAISGGMGRVFRIFYLLEFVVAFVLHGGIDKKTQTGVVLRS